MIWRSLWVEDLPLSSLTWRVEQRVVRAPWPQLEEITRTSTATCTIQYISSSRKYSSLFAKYYSLEVRQTSMVLLEGSIHIVGNMSIINFTTSSWGGNVGGTGNKIEQTKTGDEKVEEKTLRNYGRQKIIYVNGKNTADKTIITMRENGKLTK
jgi:hypothetical protein